MVFIMVMSEDGSNIIAFVYDKHYKKMLYTAQKILGHDSGEDAVNDVFVNLIQKYENNPEALRDKPGLFYVISIRNHSLNLLAKEKHLDVFLSEEICDEDLFISSEPSPEETAITSEGFDSLVALIRQLNPIMREILEYKYILEYTNKEIAKELGVSESVISSRIERARKKLRELIENKENKNGN